MNYLVVYKEGGEEKKKIIGDTKGATVFIEDLIRDKSIRADEIDLHEMTKVEYAVKNVPIVTIGADSQKEVDQHVPADPNQVVEGIESARETSSSDESLEVFTFDS